MSLSYHQRTIADPSVQGIHLRKAVGAYELLASLNLQMQSSEEDEIYYLRIEAVRLFVKGQHGSEQFIGTLLPYDLRMLRTYGHSQRECVDLSLILQPTQVAAIEDIRDGGDLTFILKIRGQAYLNSDEQRAYDDITVHTPRSAWIMQLKNSGFMDVLLIEIPFPASELPEHLEAVQHYLEEAQRQYMNAAYTACVASCRTAIEDMGCQTYNTAKWHEEALKPLKGPSSNGGGKISDMDKNEREKALLGIIRHYAHLAHHGEGEGGVRNYTQIEARMILQMTSAAISAALNKG